jgi:hypothetical protein
MSALPARAVRCPRLRVKKPTGVPQLQHPCRNSAAVIMSASAQVPEFGYDTGELMMISGSQEFADGKILAPAPEVDFALVLSRVIASAEDDPAQLRNIIYELARIKLQEEVSRRTPPPSSPGTRDLSEALESAIERVETIHSKHDSLQAIQSLDRLAGISDAAGRIVHHEAVRVCKHPLPSFSIRETPRRNTPNEHNLGGAAPLLRGAMVAILALAVCLVLDHQFGFLGSRASQALTPVVHRTEKIAKVVPEEASRQSSTSATTARSYAGVPLPTVYGIYSISAGRLHELEPLAIGRVPDQRVFMSTPVKTPSRTVLPDGRTEFIIYRRDLANDSPDRISVRVIAKVRRAMTFNSAGQASTAEVEDSWTIRNLSYDFRVGPLGDSSEMLVVRPEKEEFVLPAGRYALVVKGQAYDFTVAGPITAAAQCLERLDAANGTCYAECGRPSEKRISSASRNLK